MPPHSRLLAAAARPPRITANPALDDQRGVVHGHLVVDQDRELDGIVLGRISVARGALLHLSGVCCGALEVAVGGRVVVTGTVCGNLWAYGQVALEGAVLGDLIVRGSTLQRGPDAVVRGSVRGG